jgi:hypothetical protein
MPRRNCAREPSASPQMKPVMKGSIVVQKIRTVSIDDLDGSEAEGAVRFGLDSAAYEIDLNAEHAQALRDALSRYVQAARRAGGGRTGWIAPRSASGPRRRAST